jgi:hypothetical protein
MQLDVRPLVALADQKVAVRITGLPPGGSVSDVDAVSRWVSGRLPTRPGDLTEPDR